MKKLLVYSYLILFTVIGISVANADFTINGKKGDLYADAKKEKARFDRAVNVIISVGGNMDKMLINTTADTDLGSVESTILQLKFINPMKTKLDDTAKAFLAAR